MGNFKREGGGSRFGGRPSFGGRDGGRGGDRPRLQKRDWGEKGFSKEMFSAICSECGKKCEVPFRPMNGKPVFCTECFAANKGESSRDEAPRRSFADNRGFEKPRFDRPQNNFGGNKGGDDVSRKIEILTAKIDKLTQAVVALSGTKPVSFQKPVIQKDVVKNVTVAPVEKKADVPQKGKEAPKKTIKTKTPAKKVSKTKATKKTK